RSPSRRDTSCPPTTRAKSHPATPRHSLVSGGAARPTGPPAVHPLRGPARHPARPRSGGDRRAAAQTEGLWGATRAAASQASSAVGAQEARLVVQRASPSPARGAQSRHTDVPAGPPHDRPPAARHHRPARHQAISPHDETDLGSYSQDYTPPRWTRTAPRSAGRRVPPRRL